LLGLALGVLVLTVVISVMNGFDTELKERLLGAVPHLVVEGARAGDPKLSKLIDAELVDHSFDFFMGAGMVTRNGAVNPVSLYAIGADGVAGLEQIDRSMRFGSLAALLAAPRGIILGAPLARHLGLLPGDVVALIVSEPTRGGIRPRLLRFELVGTFELGAVLDYSLAVLSLEALGGLALERIGTLGVRLDLSDPLRAPPLKQIIDKSLAESGSSWVVTSWADNYGELFQAVQLEKLLMFLILLMVVAVAAFNIVSGQMMVVGDKQSAISILRTMGASTSLITRIFLLQGVIISGIGIGVGLVAGVIVAHNVAAVFAALEAWLGFQFLAGTYFVEVPSVVEAADLFIIAAISWSLCLISAWVPARRAALINPLEGLHRG
jgi:lipoprotein-releasing system permease protein